MLIFWADLLSRHPWCRQIGKFVSHSAG